MPRELPILMNGDMVRAVLSGTKTQTRRPLIHPYEVHGNGYITKPRGNERLCPYEAPYHKGDTLWVRETWALWHSGMCGCGGDICLCPPSGTPIFRADINNKMTEEEYGPWKPSIHMPRHAARIFLPVTSVRVERVQDITVQDIQSEGCLPDLILGHDYTIDGDLFPSGAIKFKNAFRTLWDSLYAPRGLGWDANPFVWVIEWDAYRKPAAEGE